MTQPVKMGMVVTQSTDFVERNPAVVENTRRNMERDLIESGRLPDQGSWKREDLPRGPYDLAAMTQFSLDAVSEAHVIVFEVCQPSGTFTKRIHEVQIGTVEAAEARAAALNSEHGYAPDEDGDWWSEHYTVNTVPLGYGS